MSVTHHAGPAASLAPDLVPGLAPGLAMGLAPGALASALVSAPDAGQSISAATHGAAAPPARGGAPGRTGWGLVIVALTSMAAAVLAPVWVLLISPLAFGLPHIASDVRWMIGRTPLGRYPIRLVAVAACLIAHLATGHLALGLASVPVAALATSAATPTASRRRTGTIVVGVALVVIVLASPALAARIFAQAHNAIALVVLAVFVGAVRPLLAGLALVAAGALALAVGALDGLLQATTLALPGPLGIDLPQLARSLGGTGVTGQRYALLFAFGQLVHYGVWLWLLGALDVERGSTSTPRDELGWVWWIVLALAGAGTLTLVVWAWSDLLAARQGYFRFALFHGALELAALAVLFCESSATRGGPSDAVPLEPRP